MLYNECVIKEGNLTAKGLNIRHREVLVHTNRLFIYEYGFHDLVDVHLLDRVLCHFTLLDLLLRLLLFGALFNPYSDLLHVVHDLGEESIEFGHKHI